MKQDLTLAIAWIFIAIALYFSMEWRVSTCLGVAANIFWIGVGINLYKKHKNKKF